MKQNFWTKIKEISFNDILHFFVFLLALFPAWVYKHYRRHLWLICENEMEARDNGYWLFKYIRENETQVDAVYAINPKSKDFFKVKELGETVSFGTFKHWVYYLAAEVNISSQKNGKPNAAVCYFLEVYGIRKNRRVFLQHGIISNDLPFVHYENAKFSLFVTSTKREYEYVRDNFNYPQGVVKELGLARFDQLHNIRVNSNQILVMPTWRGWISPPSHGKSVYHGVEQIRQTMYYQCWNAFLQDKEIQKLLEQQGKTMIFYQHREMQKFKGLFHSDCPNILIKTVDSADVQQLLKESAYLITDYSSIAMDFAYMDKPLWYYQFDYEEFREKHYSKGYFDYETDGFGPVCRTYETLKADLICRIFEGKEEADKYAVRRRQFFDLKDNQNCKRNYEAIVELLG
ncbi:MAG: CDP-glycerol glycerophosphotransferase family protein [Lachnospiraceae bacterium]|nr:CDP-glycerol glycerophosphotransferase family protein [Lachnospiraceae bacterium]